jgi:hypothetical protein
MTSLDPCFLPLLTTFSKTPSIFNPAWIYPDLAPSLTPTNLFLTRHKVMVWPDQLPKDRVVFLSGKDQIVPSKEVKL